MGYNSSYNGEVSADRKLTDAEVKKIGDWFVERFGQYALDENGQFIFKTYEPDGSPRWYEGDIAWRPVERSVVPSSGFMKGYNFNEHLYEFVEWAKKEMPGVSFVGEFERDGEEFGDLEVIKVEGGLVKSYQGYIAWDSPVVCEKTEAQKHAAFMAALKERGSGLIV